MIRAAVVTVSDKGSRGAREDLSGPEAAGLLKAHDIEVISIRIVPDEVEEIRELLIELADRQGVDLIVTTGGTGVTPRDVTPEATLAVLEREIPGMGEAMRRAGMATTPHAMLSRARAGIRGRTLIVNLPGSPRGVRENLAVILPAIPHAVDKIRGGDSDCAV
ncbi:MAG TPA: MogA/MoaB family molybdenum cofactor biosynthesis protein [Syntrophales bacterium]|nr:MogA/MoaB family molybdenum cofactor biosynthesis protein [Syntrophales bacterium]HON23351.1 MogA/MoaB family molybdenum cofactor biosynthesis protein [Syntrophales bacterium]HOU77121.1 MogA/MoaB family molybdenum cofactor biosynthesis protein [Syntrophales bacterium]HPC32801.1 MogA/MoaB family molybdenum cofactor biosynthesis protein [Syntrophales bacterium]HQG33649.1 MogA/MoaB family molybdenum cofactor biosynthesis protein [Syntrophales bacterium]